MKRYLTLFLICLGLELAAVDPASAQGNNPHLRFGIATRTLNNRIGSTDVLIGSVGTSYPALAPNNEGRDSTAAAVNTILAVLAGGLTLVLLQRRNHAELVLRPRH